MSLRGDGYLLQDTPLTEGNPRCAVPTVHYSLMYLFDYTILTVIIQLAGPQCVFSCMFVFVFCFFILPHTVMGTLCCCQAMFCTVFFFLKNKVPKKKNR